MPTVLLLNSCILGLVYKQCQYITWTCSMMFASCWKPLCDLYVVHAVFFGPFCAAYLCKIQAWLCSWSRLRRWSSSFWCPRCQILFLALCRKQWMKRSARPKLLSGVVMPSFSSYHLFLEMPELTKYLFHSLRIFCLWLFHCVLSSVGQVTNVSQAVVQELGIGFFFSGACSQSSI